MRDVPCEYAGDDLPGAGCQWIPRASGAVESHRGQSIRETPNREFSRQIRPFVDNLPQPFNKKVAKTIPAHMLAAQ